MNSDLVVFVEGGSDTVFLRSLFSHIDLPEPRFEPIDGGVSKLEKVKPVIIRACNEASRTAIIFDADDDYSRAHTNLRSEISRLSLPVQKFFLLPNDSDSGCLENLLERIAVTQYSEIYRCFDAYENCLRSSQTDYRVPNLKARIYAYCEALDIETNANKRDYGDQQYWDLDSPDLQPLMNFLRSL